MTISNETNRTSAVGSGATGQVVPFAFVISLSSDLLVRKRVTATGVPTTLAETTNYTVTISDDGTGSITTVTAIETTETIHVINNTPFTQTLDLEHGGSFSSENQESAYDRNTKLAIYLKDAIDRIAKASDTDPTSAIGDWPNSIDRASKVAGWDSDGKPTALEAVPEGSVAFTGFGETIAEAADADTARGLLELDTDDDVEFAAITGTTGTFTTLISKRPFVDITAFGAGASESAATNATAIQAALDSLTAGGAILVPQGTFSYDTTLEVSSRTGIIGTGPNSSILKFTAVDGTNAIEIIGTGDNTADAATAGTIKQWCWMREVGVSGNASSGHGITTDIARYLTFINVHSSAHGGDCWHHGAPPVTAAFGTRMGRISMINCHSAGGTNSVYAGGGDILITGKGGFNDASAIGIILEDMRISYINNISGGSSNAAASHAIEIRSSVGNTTGDYDMYSIHLNNIHWEQLASGDNFVNVNMGGTTELSDLSITECEHSLRTSNFLVLSGVVTDVWINHNQIRSRAIVDSAVGITIGSSCTNINVGPNSWEYGVNITDNSAGELTFEGGLKDKDGNIESWKNDLAALIVTVNNEVVCVNNNVVMI